MDVKAKMAHAIHFGARPRATDNSDGLSITRRTGLSDGMAWSPTLKRRRELSVRGFLG